MRSGFRTMICAACCATLIACASNNNRPRVVGAAGEIVFKEGNARGEAVPADKYKGWIGLQAMFKSQAEKAARSKASTSDIKSFMQTGFTLVHLGCNAYIEQKADRQRSIGVVRDSFAPITALITGIIGIANDGDTDSDYLTAIALATTAASTGFDIYEDRFLFGAKNVNEVRTLVLRNQLAHADKAMTTINDNPSYNQAIIHLLKNQMTCSPAEILEKVNEAIKQGTITARPVVDSPQGQTPEDDQDIQRYEALITLLNEEGILTEDQLGKLRAMIEQQEDSGEVNVAADTTPNSANVLNSIETRVD